LSDEPLWLEGDLVRLAQALGNLLCNAAKYTEAGGEMGLHAAREGAQAVIRVSDTGIGIAPEMLPRLFEMFMQVAPGANRSQGGLGIGLTLARNLVAMHGGTIEARSDGVGKGSEFIVRLPAAASPAPIAEATLPALTQQITARKILVVDDNPDAAQSLAVLLKLRGHEVEIALGGSEALRIVELRLPEWIFLDIGMPDVDGYEVARQLRSRFSGNLALVALTGWGTEQDRQRSREAGFDHHLTKPVDLAALEAVLAGENESLKSEGKSRAEPAAV
jgi:CheY-like chemotaxis protein